MEVLSEFAKYAFSVLKRKSRNFERSVLKYVGIKISALTHSGWKSRFYLNAADRLLPFRQVTHLNCNERFSALRHRVSPHCEVGKPKRRAVCITSD